MRKRAFVPVVAAVILFAATIPVRAAEDQKKEQKNEKPHYVSSIQVPNDDQESTEAKKNEHENENEADEAREEAQLSSMAKITKEQAIAAARKSVSGKFVHAALENENGNLVYSVEIKTSHGTADVKVDAGNGKVLFVDRD